MDRNFNINEDLSNISTTPSDVNNVINNLQIVGNVIDTTLNRSSNITSSTKITPPPGIRINGKYPERNYITFDTSLLSNVTPYSSNIYVPVSSRITIQTPTTTTPTTTTPTTTTPTTTTPTTTTPTTNPTPANITPIGRAGFYDGEEVTHTDGNVYRWTNLTGGRWLFQRQIN